jgi:hypothetical protein
MAVKLTPLLLSETLLNINVYFMKTVSLANIPLTFRISKFNSHQPLSFLQTQKSEII